MSRRALKGMIMGETNGRVRITDESIANIKVATTATIDKANGGYTVRVENQYGGENLKNGDGDAVYKTRAAAVKVIERHNSDVKIQDKVVLPSASMRPPEDKS